VTLNAQFGIASALNLTLVRFDRRLDPFLQEFGRLLRSPPYEGTGVEEFIEVVPDRFEELVGAHSVDQVVLSSLLLDDGTGFVREYSDLLVADLSVSSLLDDSHDDVLNERGSVAFNKSQPEKDRRTSVAMKGSSCRTRRAMIAG